METDLERAGLELTIVIGLGFTEAEVPFTDERGAIACIFEQTGRGGHGGGNEQRCLAIRDTFVQTRAVLPPRILPGDERVTCGRANRGGGVTILEAQALAGQAVDVRRLYQRAAVATGIAPADVIGEDDEDVWRSECMAAKQRRDREELED